MAVAKKKEGKVASKARKVSKSRPKKAVSRKRATKRATSKKVAARIARIRKVFSSRKGSSVPEVSVARGAEKRKKGWVDTVAYIAFKNFSENPFKEKPFTQFKEKPFDQWKDFWNYIEWKDKK